METKIKEEIQKIGKQNLELINFLKNRIFDFFNNQTNVNNYSILGGWGTGKTEVFKKLEKYIIQNEKNQKIKFIWINLWEYELLDENVIFIKIILKIIKELSEILKKDKLKLKQWGERCVNFFKKIGSVTNFSVSVPFINTFGLEIGLDSNTLKQDLKTKKDFRNDMKDLTEDFEKIVEDLKTEIVIIFDDLDRCQENKILSILTAIKNFFFQTRSNKIFYLTALNEEYVNGLLKCQLKNERYTEKIFLKENKLEINNLIKYDLSIRIISLTEQVDEIGDIYLKKFFESLKSIDEIISRHFKNILKMNFREINSKLEFIYDINFIKKLKMKVKNGDELMDEIFLEILKRENFLSWNNFKNDFMTNGFTFVEEILWKKKLVDDQETKLKIEDLANVEGVEIISLKQNILSKISSDNLGAFMNSNYLSFENSNFFIIKIKPNLIFNFYDFVYFLNPDIDFEIFFKKMKFEQKRNGAITIFWINFEDLQLLINNFFLIYIMSKLELWKTMDFNTSESYKMVNLSVKILKSDGTY